MVYLVSSPNGVFNIRDTAESAAKTLREPWSWLRLRNEIAAMQLGDQILVDGVHWVIAVNPSFKEFR